jgi:class I fructose-bisphosphate aldolase
LLRAAAARPGSGEVMTEYYKAPKLAELDLPLGKRTRLQRMMYEYGPGQGKLLILPLDQGIEHGPVDFFVNPLSKHPLYQLELARLGGYSAVAVHYGLAYKYMKDYAGSVPLVVKLNGKTNIPGDDAPHSTLTASVLDAVRIGADAVGLTLYVGSGRQGEDISQFMQVRSDCEKYGLPLILWSYPRGADVETKGGRDSFYAVDYGARLAEELGAEVVKLHVPKIDSARDKNSPAPYDSVGLDAFAAFRQVVESAGRSFVLVSGGSKLGDDDMLEKVGLSMKAGATGLIFGRNMWQRPMDEALAITARVKEIMLQY